MTITPTILPNTRCRY